jgi:hypothetical protein
MGLTIKLKGNLDFDLRKLGLKEGDIIRDCQISSYTTQSIYFSVIYNGFECHCVVWPANYEIIETH